jgi:RND family efflux transporter MFP subunit
MNPFLLARRLLPAVALAALTACSKHAPPPGAGTPALPTATVAAQPVGQASHLATEDVVGTVRPKLSAVVEAKVSGRILQLPVVAGQKVSSGELLVQLDAREIRARLDQALAVRDQAAADLVRFTALLKQEAVTRAEFDAVQARQRIADAAVAEAETLLTYMRITAPFDGVVTRKHADIGDLASPGRALVELEDPDHLRLEASVPEALIGHLRQGAVLRVRIASLDRLFEGSVAEIAPASDPGSRTFLVRIDLPADPALRSGQFGRAAIPIGAFAALRVPAAAVVQQGQLEVAFVIRDQKATLRLVRTGKRIGDELEILAGLDADDTVVTEGAAGLRDGQPVRLK